MTAAGDELKAEKRCSLTVRSASSRAPGSRLHNFSFPTLSWGSRKLLRCVNLAARSGHPDPVQTPPRSPDPEKDSHEDEQESPLGQAEAPAPATVAAVRPWNLRTRRAACRAPYSPSASPAREEKRSEDRDDRERREFSVSLSKAEIVEDFLLLNGTKPPRRPKKRPRTVQRQLDSLFPGLWLCEVTLDSYEDKRPR